METPNYVDLGLYPSWLVPVETAIELKKIGFNLHTQNRTTFDVINNKNMV